MITKGNGIRNHILQTIINWDILNSENRFQLFIYINQIEIFRLFKSYNSFYFLLFSHFRNIVYNLSISDLSEQRRLIWHSPENDVKMCVMKGKDDVSINFNKYKIIDIKLFDTKHMIFTLPELFCIHLDDIRSSFLFFLSILFDWTLLSISNSFMSHVKSDRYVFIVTKWIIVYILFMPNCQIVGQFECFMCHVDNSFFSIYSFFLLSVYAMSTISIW